MVEPLLFPVLALVVFVFFMFYLGYLFLIDVLQIAINAIILYILGLRIWAEWKARESWQLYFFSGGAAFLILVVTGNFLKPYWIWLLTIFVMITFIIAQVSNWVIKEQGKK